MCAEASVDGERKLVAMGRNPATIQGGDGPADLLCRAQDRRSSTVRFALCASSTPRTLVNRKGRSLTLDQRRRRPLLLSFKTSDPLLLELLSTGKDGHPHRGHLFNIRMQPINHLVRVLLVLLLLLLLLPTETEKWQPGQLLFGDARSTPRLPHKTAMALQISVAPSSNRRLRLCHALLY